MSVLVDGYLIAFCVFLTTSVIYRIVKFTRKKYEKTQSVHGFVKTTNTIIHLTPELTAQMNFPLYIKYGIDKYEKIENKEQKMSWVSSDTPTIYILYKDINSKYLTAATNKLKFGYFKTPINKNKYNLRKRSRTECSKNSFYISLSETKSYLVEMPNEKIIDVAHPVTIDIGIDKQHKIDNLANIYKSCCLQSQSFSTSTSTSTLRKYTLYLTPEHKKITFPNIAHIEIQQNNNNNNNNKITHYLSYDCNDIVHELHVDAASGKCTDKVNFMIQPGKTFYKEQTKKFNDLVSDNFPYIIIFCLEK